MPGGRAEGRLHYSVTDYSCPRLWGLNRTHFQSSVSRVLYKRCQAAKASGRGSQTTRSHRGENETVRRGANAQGLSDGARTRTPGAPHARPHPPDSTGARAAPASRSGIRPPAPAEGPPEAGAGQGRRNPRGARRGPRRVYFAGDFCPAELYLFLAAFLNFPASLKQRVNRFIRIQRSCAV